jgi:hypothetical protein
MGAASAMLREGFAREPFETLARTFEGGVETLLSLDFRKDRQGKVVLSGIGKA